MIQSNGGITEMDKFKQNMINWDKMNDLLMLDSDLYFDMVFRMDPEVTT